MHVYVLSSVKLLLLQEPKQFFWLQIKYSTLKQYWQYTSWVTESTVSLSQSRQGHIMRLDMVTGVGSPISMLALTMPGCTSSFIIELLVDRCPEDQVRTKQANKQTDCHLCFYKTTSSDGDKWPITQTEMRTPDSLGADEQGEDTGRDEWPERWWENVAQWWK